MPVRGCWTGENSQRNGRWIGSLGAMRTALRMERPIMPWIASLSQSPRCRDIQTPMASKDTSRKVLAHVAAQAGVGHELIPDEPALMLGERRAPAGNPVLDAVVAQRVPVGRGVDGDDGLAKPELRRRGDA